MLLCGHLRYCSSSRVCINTSIRVPVQVVPRCFLETPAMHVSAVQLDYGLRCVLHPLAAPGSSRLAVPQQGLLGVSGARRTLHGGCQTDG